MGQRLASRCAACGHGRCGIVVLLRISGVGESIFETNLYVIAVGGSDPKRISESSSGAPGENPGQFFVEHAYIYIGHRLLLIPETCLLVERAPMPFVLRGSAKQVARSRALFGKERVGIDQGANDAGAGQHNAGSARSRAL